MQFFRVARWLLPALLFSLIPASSHAQLAISVDFAPPELPVYEQPMCPEPNLMWVPGYWAYSEDDGDYYWVPGTWVEAPYEGALWTPDYWDWYGGHYRFHRGYWGRHVGYYGGVDYGYGYGGIGFSGGEWRGNEFAYNTAVMHVNDRVIHTTYNDRTIVERNTIANNGRVSYNGGPGGIKHAPTASEQVASRGQHTAPTRVQTQHATAARSDKSSYSKANGGHPQRPVVEKPLSAKNNAAPAGVRQGQVTKQAQQKQTQTQQRQQTQQKQAQTQQRQQAQQQQSRPAPQQQSRPAPQQQSRPAPQQQSRPAPQQHSAPAPQQHSAPAQKENKPPGR